MKKTSLAFLFAFWSIGMFAQLYQGKSNTISFFSDAPLEDIEGTAKSAVIVMNTASGEVAAQIKVKDFEFESGTMKDHFNENYMESEKFPTAKFVGKITDKEKVNFKKDGVYKTKVSGTLTIHGVARPRSIDGTFTVKGGDISFDAKFPVALKDHNIEIPEMVFNKISENVELRIQTLMQPRK